MLRTMDAAEMTRPMREELVRAGFQEMTTPEEVDRILEARNGKVLVFVNSVCGCAAGSARPGVIEAVKGLEVPVRLTTVFAGQDREATTRARKYFHEFPPSSPSVVLLNDGAPTYILERRQIEGRSPNFVAAELRRALEVDS
jgi:putative YphP/YqiW family bacilliredoxin